MIAKWHKTIGIVFILSIILMNGIAYFYLPDVLIMQITISGGAGTTLGKNYVMIGILFLGLLISYYLFTLKKPEELSRWFIGMIIVFVGNLFIIIYNL